MIMARIEHIAVRKLINTADNTALNPSPLVTNVYYKIA